MSAPIAVGATAGSTRLQLTSSISNSSLVAVPVGMWAKASISPLSELAREARKRSRSATPIVHTPTGLPDKFAAVCDSRGSGAGARLVETEPGANTGLGFGHCQISVKVDLLVFEAAPQPLDKDVVHAPAVAVHADHDPVPFQGAGKVVAGELAALIGIEDLGEP